MRKLYLICLALLFSIATGARNQFLLASEGGNSRLSIDVVVEQLKGGDWQRVDAQTVFHTGDVVRFRFRASQKGYLYVLNSSSDKTTSWLFPRSGSTERSQVDARMEYFVPTGKGVFEVGGSPGFDITYWILSPTPIDTAQSFVPAATNETSTLEPRCRSEVLKSRGLCVDDRAGPHSVDNPLDLPVHPPESEKLRSRDLKFKSEEGTTQISGLTHESDVIVYQFTIAHD
jgi:hypothetical protein